MDPNFTSDRPGKSPMGMDLVPVYADEGENQPEGTVRIDPTFVQRIGVRTAAVERRDIAQTIHTVGTIAHNDKQIAWVNTKIDGWIENVAVNYLGETVEKGQVLFDIYSPQLVTTQTDYLTRCAMPSGSTPRTTPTSPPGRSRWSNRRAPGSATGTSRTNRSQRSSGRRRRGARSRWSPR